MSKCVFCEVEVKNRKYCKAHVYLAGEVKYSNKLKRVISLLLERGNYGADLRDNFYFNDLLEWKWIHLDDDGYSFLTDYGKQCYNLLIN